MKKKSDRLVILVTLITAMNSERDTTKCLPWVITHSRPYCNYVFSHSRTGLSCSGFCFSVQLLQFLPRDATQSAGLLRQVVCPSVTLRYRDHIGSKINSPLVSLGYSISADPNITDLLQREHPKIFTQSDPPPVELSVADIDGKLQPNGQR